jgi:pimeloyl-ACP methyl ester carboxylesterase
VPPPLPELPGVEHRYATVGDVKLHYAEAGQGEPLVLQHGWPQHWWMWRHQIAPLAERFRVICPDLRGHGWSDKPAGDYRKDQLMRDLIGLLDELGLEKVRYVGHDWGAYSGMLAALRHPERFERFGWLSMPHPWQRDRNLVRLASVGWYQLVLAAPVVGKLAISQGFTTMMLQSGRADSKFTEEEVETYVSVIREPDATEASMRMYRHFLLYELMPTMSGAFKEERLRVPTLWLAGEQDPVAGAADEGCLDHADDILFEKLPGVGHFLPEEAPDVLTKRLLEFL